MGAIYAVCASVEQAHAEAIERGFARALRDAPPLAFGELDDSALEAAERAWWRAVAGAALADAGLLARIHFDRFFDLAWHRFGSVSTWRVLDDVRPVLRGLRAAGVPLAVFSNWDRRLIPLLAGLALDGFFARVLVSSALGAAKPDPTAYELAAAAFARGEPGWRGAPVMVGDRLDHDVVPALAAGWDAIWLDRSDRDESSGGTRRVRSLTELSECLTMLGVA